MAILFVVMALLGGGAWFRAQQGEVETVRDYYRRGQKLQREGKMREALLEYRLAAERNPAFAEPQLAIADLHRDDGNLAAAIQTLERLADRNPLATHLQCRLAELYFEQGRITNARDAAGRAVKADRRCARAHAMMGIVFAEQRELAAALRELEASHRIEPHNEKVALTLVQMRANNLLFHPAQELAERIVQDHPQSARAHFILGWLLAQDAQKDSAKASGAKKHLEESLRLSPDDNATRAELGRLLVKTGEADKAIPLLEKVWSADQRIAAVAFELSQAYQELNDPRAGKLRQEFKRLTDLDNRWQELRKRQKLEPNNARIQHELVAIELQRGAKLEALALLQDLLRADPDDEQALAQLHVHFPQIGAGNRAPVTVP